MQPTKPSNDAEADRDAMVRMIARIARDRGVPPHVALAFARVESNFNPRAEGDLDWGRRKGGELYRRLVLSRPEFSGNPARLDPDAWHSYGLFQLLAPYHVRPLEHPAELLRPELNAIRGVELIKRLLARTGGDPVAARLAYVGCGTDGSLCPAATAQRVRDRIVPELERWRLSHG